VPISWKGSSVADKVRVKKVRPLRSSGLSLTNLPRCPPSGDWFAAVTIAVLIAAGLCFLYLYRSRTSRDQRTQFTSRTLRTQPSEPKGANLKGRIERLATEAWGSREDIVSNGLLLRREAVSKVASPSELVSTLLRHVSRIAPNLSVPTMTPRVVHETLFGNVAGQFVEQDGWVKIVVGATFFDDRAAAHAILCHELCHYVLEANGIREQSTLENERLTDAAIFVFGLGDIFLASFCRERHFAL
jgi:hypothetical protein